MLKIMANGITSASLNLSLIVYRALQRRDATDDITGQEHVGQCPDTFALRCVATRCAGVVTGSYLFGRHGPYHALWET